MFITIGYLILYFYEKYKTAKEGEMGFTQTMGRHLRHASVVLRSNQPQLVKLNNYSPLIEPCTSAQSENLLFSRNGKQLFVVSPKLQVKLDGWVSYLGHTSAENRDELSNGNKIFVLLETEYPEDEEEFLQRSFSIPQNKRMKVVECVSPIAWKSGNPFGILAECSEGRLNSLCTAFIEGRLVLDDLLELNQIITVDVEGKPTNLLSMQTSAVQSSTPKKRLTVDNAWDSVLEDLHSSTADLGSNCLDSNESLASGVDSTIRDFLASEQSVDDLESEENMGKSEDDLGDIEREESDLLDGGESLSGPVEDLAPETLTPVRRRTIAQSKPPNILVYCGKKDSQRQFEMVRNTLQQCINVHRYVIYNLKHDQVLSSPWADNTVLLIIASEKVYDGVDQAFLDYFLQGGLVISFGSAFDDLFTNKVLVSGSASVMPLSYKQWENVTVICTRHQYEKELVSKLDNVSLRMVSVDKSRGSPVVLEANHDITNAAAILTQVNLDKDAAEMAISPEIFSALKQANPSRCAILKDMLTSLGLDTDQGPVGKLSPAMLFATSQELKDKFTETINKRCKDNILRSRNITLEFVKDKTSPISEAREDRIPLLLTPDVLGKEPSFNFKLYKTYLTSKCLGHTVIFSDVISSTMPVIDCLMMSMSEDQGLVVMAKQQVSGKGRGGNSWLSPDGCLCFSTHLRVSLSSVLGGSLGVVQHMAALAVVHGIRQHTQYQDLDLRLKWPNDIYFGDKMKLGGILVQSSVIGSTVHINIGIGVNVSNKNPTVCINDLIEQHSHQTGTVLEALSLEQVLGYAVSSLEEIIETYQNGDIQSFFDLYYKYWLHSGCTVMVESLQQNVKIMGIDEQGYLKVKLPDGSTSSLQPDGNSFDMMRNLVYLKSS